MHYDVYAIGNALVDHLAYVDDQLLINKNIKKGIMTLVDTPPQINLFDDHKHEVKMCSGGSAANTIVGLTVLGGKGCYTGKVGQDKLGEFYEHDLSRNGVDFFTSPIDKPTGSCVSLVSSDAERSMLTYLGASIQLHKNDIHEEAIQHCQYVYIEGYLWDSVTAREAAITAMVMAKKHGKKVALTYSDPWLVERFRDDFSHITKEYVDLVFCNKREAEEITGSDQPIFAAKQLATQVSHVCITLGEEGALVSENGKVRATPLLDVPAVKDTTGAGDLYAAGVLRGLTLGFDLITSSLIGTRAAAAIIEKLGARLEHSDLV